MKILDCTLRDGGYYTNWDFDSKLVDSYFHNLNELPVDYLEIGYRSPCLSGYHGEFYYCPEFLLKKIASISKKKLVIILNEKDIVIDEVKQLLKPCIGVITMVRIAIDPSNLIRAIDLARKVKEMGFEIGFNVMYMSKWKEHNEFISNLKFVDEVADYFYMVDSYGGVYPNDVREIYALVRQYVKAKIGFHGHNNMELALINSLTAIECGVEIVDSTITGMGRGAGNLKTELLLTALNQKDNLEVNFNSLSAVTDVFSELQKHHEWGTNLPYMVSGANSLPQKDVMDWVGKRYYSYNSIIRALQNQSKGQKDNERLPIFDLKTNEKVALIVGGGNSVIEHSDSIREFLLLNQNTIVIHASSKNAIVFNELSNTQIFCLVGNEGHRMEDVFKEKVPKNVTCVLPPFPRKMGTYIPINLKSNSFELSKNTFTSSFVDSHTAIALQTVLDLNVEHVFLVGYDGYNSQALDEKAQDLLNENRILFERFITIFSGEFVSLTPTVYPISVSSIYARLS